jgi:hypothetical protein
VLIGIDYDKLKVCKDDVNFFDFGLRDGGGLANGIGDESLECFRWTSLVEGALYQYAGINNPLGPTIEYNKSHSWGEFNGKDLKYKKPR